FVRRRAQSSADALHIRVPTANSGGRGFRELGGKCPARSLRPGADAGKGTLNLTGSLLCDTNGVINGFHQILEIGCKCDVCGTKLHAISQRRSPPKLKGETLRPGA